jgi:hypothetical protein
VLIDRDYTNRSIGYETLRGEVVYRWLYIEIGHQARHTLA